MPRVTITVPEKTPQPYRFQLERESVTLGRGSENDIAIDCGSVSVKHAEMRRVGGGYELRDLGSTNGIKVNGERKTTVALRNGLSVQLGDVAFDFLLTDEELDALADEKTATSRRKELPDSSESGESRRSAPRPGAMPADQGGGFGMIVLFIILAAAAFFAGMAVRFQKDTGGSLIEAISGKSKPQAETPAVGKDTTPANEAAPPAPAADDGQ
jgi:pSer/pThr/pTyr-binding forkhead associated (FHA) protein